MVGIGLEGRSSYTIETERQGGMLAITGGLVEELHLTDHNKETLLFTEYPCYASLKQLP